MVDKALFSSASDNHATPQEFFDSLNEEFHFDLDVCASDDNHKVANYYTIEDDALNQDWTQWKSIWMNPPYGKTIETWCARAAASQNVVALLPARTDTKWWHTYVSNVAETRFIKGRLKFGGAKNVAPFPSVVVIWRPDVVPTKGIVYDSKGRQILPNLR